MELTPEHKQTIKENFEVKTSTKQHFYIPSMQDVMTDMEYDIYYPNYSQNKAMDNGFIIPFVPAYDL